jgi:hypothetical protein
VRVYGDMQDRFPCAISKYYEEKPSPGEFTRKALCLEGGRESI